MEDLSKITSSRAAKLTKRQYLSRSSSMNTDCPVLVSPLENIVVCNEEKTSQTEFGCVKLHRTLCLFPNLFNYFVNVISKTKQLRKLDAGGNLAGPIAFRALLSSLIKHNEVEELDLSNSLVDADCAEFVRSYISNSNKLQKLNLSGNKLGRESLSRSLCVALQRSTGRVDHGNLTELNISNCGLVYLHSLFEGLRVAMSCETCSLTHLNVSDNVVRDGQQLGSDISLVLEHQKCTLKHLSISNVGLNAVGFDSVVSGLRANQSLVALYAGGSLNHVKNITKIKDALFASRSLCVIDLKDVQADEVIKYNLANRSSLGLFDFEVRLTDINLSNCSITDEFLLQMIPKFSGKLTAVKTLDLSYNKGISSLSGLKELLLFNGVCSLEILNLSGLNLKQLCNVLSYCELLHTLILEDSNLQEEDFASLCKMMQSLNNLNMNNTMVVKMKAIPTLCSFPFSRQLTSLSLNDCFLYDKIVEPLVNAICQDKSTSLNLRRLDLSNNFVNKEIFKIFDYLHHFSRYPLEQLDVINTKMTDETAKVISKFITLPSCKSKLRVLNTSENELTSPGISSLIESMATKSRGTGLLHLDVSNQTHLLTADEFETIAERLIDIALENDGFSWLEKDKLDTTHELPPFYVNLTKLQKKPSLKPCSKMLLLSSSVHTDLSEEIKPFGSLTDYLLLAAGLDKCSNDPTSATESGTTAAFTHEQWQSVITRQAPKWLKVVNEEKKVVYLSSLPENLTEDLLKETLYDECGCLVNDIHSIKDCIFDIFLNSAWVLCEDEQSYRNVIDWYTEGRARISGNCVRVCPLPVSVLDANERIDVAARNETKERALREKMERDSGAMKLEPSKLIAEETAILTKSWTFFS